MDDLEARAREAANKGRDSVLDWWAWAYDNPLDATISTVCFFAAGFLAGYFVA